MSKEVIFSLAVGVAIGVCVSSAYFKKKYELIAQSEIDSVKEVLGKHMPEKPENDKDHTDKPDQEPNFYSGEALKAYKRYSGSGNESDKSASDLGPYVISPNEFGTMDEYETVSLTYYSKDNVLTDDNDEIVDDVDEIIGQDSLKHFGEYEDDSVYVRNDRRKCDYEILLDESDYHKYYGGD